MKMKHKPLQFLFIKASLEHFMHKIEAILSIRIKEFEIIVASVASMEILNARK